MNFVATLEEYLRDLAYMARSSSTKPTSLPSVKEASERAIQKLRQLQANYITAVRLASSTSTTASSSSTTTTTQPQQQQQYPTTSLFQSSDLLHPFLLVLNYPNAEYSILEKSFRAIRLLMEHNVIVPTDAIHILRVYQIQAIVVTTFYYNHTINNNNIISHHHHKNNNSNNNKRTLISHVSRRKPPPPSTTKLNHSMDDDEEEDDDNDDDDDDDDDDEYDDESHDTTAVQRTITSSTTANNNNTDTVSVTTTITKDDDDDDTTDTQRHLVANDARTTADTAVVASSTTTTSGSISSWFGWGGTSTPPTTETDDSMDVAGAAAAASSTHIPLRNSFIIKRNAVSSSSGGSGTNLSAKHMESLALEILSSLVQLMELLRNHHSTILRQSTDIWTNATALACLFGFQWYTPYQQQQISSSTPTSSSSGSGSSGSSSTNLATTSRQSTVQQAANATVSQLICSLFSTQSDPNAKFVQSTWDDLLALTSSSTTKAKMLLNGTFQQCKRKVNTYHTDHLSSHSTTPTPATAATPPSPEFALELMTQIWKDMSNNSNGEKNKNSDSGNKFKPTDAMIVKSMGVTMSLIQKLHKTSVEKSLRIVQWTLMFIQSTAETYPNECRELLLLLFKQITIVTDQCRSNHDFEDGYVYPATRPVTDELNDMKRKSVTLDAVTTLFPMAQLWKAGFVLEAMYYILDRCGNSTDEGLSLIIFGMDSERKILQTLVEALSDFATIGTSCRDHIHQVVEFCCHQNPSSIKPTIFRRAEHGIAIGTNFTIQNSYSSDPSTTKSVASDKGKKGPPPILGETIWLALQGILRINDCLLLQKSSSMSESIMLFREIFPPSLSILQHFLKRFIGSEELVELALRGYTSLADICLPIEDCSVERKVLLTSLSKLSLPSWGKHSASCQLQDHHIRSLLCLLRIVHVHYNHIMSDWEIVLWTFEELSVLDIASQHLSDSAYHASLAIAAIFERFSSFSTCFSDEAVIQMTAALSEICATTMSKRDVVGDSDTVLPERVKQSIDSNESERTTISEKIMSTAVRALYGSSTSVDIEKTEEAHRPERTKNVYYQDYRGDLLNRVSKSKFTLRTNSIGRIPFALVVLTDVAMSNTFRSKECCLTISAKLSDLAVVSPITRPLVMDILTMLMMARLSSNLSLPVTFQGPGKIVVEDPMHSQLLAVESIMPSGSASESQQFSQAEVMAPLCEAVQKAQKPDVAKASLDCLNTILEGAGQILSGNVWSLMIDAIASLSGDPTYASERSKPDWSACSLAAFRLLKLIVDDFLDQLPKIRDDSNDEGVAAHVSLLECCSSFVISRHDINTSLTSIGLLWTIADQVADTESIDRALSKLVLLSSDDRTEVRNAAVNTLFSCIVGRGSGFTSSNWESCIFGTVFRVYDIVLQKVCAGDAYAIDRKEGGKTTKYIVNLHHSRDSSAKLWVATQVLVLQGLLRVLRIFFPQLLSSCDGSGTYWFHDAWAKILEFAFDAAGQGRGRENLEIRLVGFELLIACCQLGSQAGIEGGGTSARVSTNMEVVNGALRSVRDSTPVKVARQRSFSSTVNDARHLLFFEAFESLEAIVTQVIKARKAEDDIDLQVLNKFSVGLGRLYDCCRRSEMKSEEGTIILQKIGSTSQDNDEADLLEVRFVQIVVYTLDSSTIDNNARYLNQGQRGCFEVLRLMASFGSPVAFDHLTTYAGPAFFTRKEADNDESETQEEDKSFTTVLNLEASVIAAQEISQNAVCDECKVFVLNKILLNFLLIHHSKELKVRRQYKSFIPFLTSGVASLGRIQEKGDVHSKNAANIVWKNILSCLSSMLTPVMLGRELYKIPRVPEIITIVLSINSTVPKSFSNELVKYLSDGADKAVDAAKQHAINATVSPESDFGRKSKRHRDDLLKLLYACYSGCCTLGPEQTCTHTTAAAILNAALSSSAEAVHGLHTDAVLLVCQCIEEHINMESLIASIFPQLCSLIMSDNTRLKNAAGKLLTNANISKSLQTAKTLYEESERRAVAAERRVVELEGVVNELQYEKSQLQQELSVAKETPRRGLW